MNLNFGINYGVFRKSPWEKLCVERLDTCSRQFVGYKWTCLERSVAFHQFTQFSIWTSIFKTAIHYSSSVSPHLACGSQILTHWKTFSLILGPTLLTQVLKAKHCHILLWIYDPHTRPGSLRFNLAVLSRIEQDKETHQRLAQRDQFGREFGREFGGRGLDSRSEGTKLCSHNKLFKAISIKPASEVARKSGSRLS